MKSRHYEARAHFNSEEVVLGVVTLSDNRPSITHDLGSKLRFLKEESDYKIMIAGIGDEDIFLGRVEIVDNVPVVQRLSQNYLALKEISSLDALTFGLKNAFENFYDEIHKK